MAAQITSQIKILFKMLNTDLAIAADCNGWPHEGQRMACELTSRAQAGHLIRSGADAAGAGSSKEFPQSWHSNFPFAGATFAELHLGQFMEASPKSRNYPAHGQEIFRADSWRRSRADWVAERQRILARHGVSGPAAKHNPS